MKNYLIAVGIVTGVLIVFVTAIQLDLSMFPLWILFLSRPILVCWMVWSVLTADVEVRETLEDRWYQDAPELTQLN